MTPPSRGKDNRAIGLVAVAVGVVFLEHDGEIVRACMHIHVRACARVCVHVSLRGHVHAGLLPP